MLIKEKLACVQDLEGSNLDCAMAQHLLVAADRFQLPRLRRICERRLCETVEVLACILHSRNCPSLRQPFRMHMPLGHAINPLIEGCCPSARTG